MASASGAPPRTSAGSRCVRGAVVEGVVDRLGEAEPGQQAADARAARSRPGFEAGVDAAERGQRRRDHVR